MDRAMGATDIIAGYAAIVSTAALVWQIRNEDRKQRQQNQPRRPFVNVRLDDKPSTNEAAKHDDFSIEVTNLSDYDLRISEFGLNTTVAGATETVTYSWKRANISVVAAHDSILAPVPADTADGAFISPFTLRVAPWVRLSTGSRIYGHWKTIVPISRSDDAKKRESN
jgi:hypothetical protein